MTQLTFNIPEILSLIGIIQCVYVLVYMLLRVKQLSRIGLPVVYFFALATAFFSDFGYAHLHDVFAHYDVFQWAAWFFLPPLSVLLIVQISKINQLPALHYYAVLLFVPAAYFASSAVAKDLDMLRSLLIISGLIAGGVSLLLIWGVRDLFQSIKSLKKGHERYWLIIALIMMNICFLLVALSGAQIQNSMQDMALLRTLLGLGFVYVVTTSLFRIYPQALTVNKSSGHHDNLTEDEIRLAVKIEELLSVQKIYHEENYSRSDLARECGVSEAAVSKIINEYFKKSLPQLLNERRIEDAKWLLTQTDAAVSVICSEVGFNSLPSFNRVFKNMTGESPSNYRKLYKKS